MAVEIAMGIQPGLSRIPKGVLDPICERYGVGKKYPSKLWKRVKTQIDNTQELDLSNQKRSGRPSLLTPSKIAALKKVNSQNRSFTLRQVSDQLTASVLVLVWSPQMSCFQCGGHYYAVFSMRDASWIVE